MATHTLGQCNCGQYHLTVLADSGFVVSTSPNAHYLGSWAEPEKTTSYEGRHRSE